MNHLYKTFEFDVILEKVAAYSNTSMGKDRILHLKPMTNYYQLKDELDHLDEVIRIIYSYDSCPFSGIYNIESSLNKASKDGVLLIEELFTIAQVIEGTRKIKDFAKNVPISDIPYFKSLVDELVIATSLSNQILNCISPTYEIYDNASSELRKIRKEMKLIEGEVKNKLNHLVRTHSEYMSDAVVTYRNGRMVVPLKVNHKYALGGIIHDLSASGQTAFVEPSIVMELNATLSRLKEQEKEEIHKILKGLSMLVKEDYEELSRNQEILCELDFLFAKGLYARETKSNIASLSNENEIELKRARHPLLDPTRVVPNDFILKDDKKMILITGPNAGGKTVALKTVGLFALMNQCGLALPCDKAVLGIFDKIFASIGDEQSIINSLSTFSSHLTRIIDIVNNITSNSLVVIDEIGGGTDPKEGEALAMAILEYLHDHNCCTLVSTHYSNLKSFAFDSGYIINASMEFDEANLKPAYKLQLGVPGQSYAFEISKRLGLKGKIIRRSKEFKRKYSTRYERLMNRMEKELNKIRFKERELKEKESEIEARLNELTKKEEILEKEKQKIKEEADLKVQELISDAKKQINEIVEKIKEKEESSLKMHEWINAYKELDDLSEEDEEEIDEDSKDFEIDDYVFISTLSKSGTIIQKKSGKYVVDIGGVKVNVKGEDLVRSKKKEEPKVNVSSSLRATPSKHVPVELNLIGMRVEEALNSLDKYLDDVLLVHLKHVRIIHGHGTGALRNAVHNYLRSKSFVKEFRLGIPQEGGVGATIVKLGDDDE